MRQDNADDDDMGDAREPILITSIGRRANERAVVIFLAAHHHPPRASLLCHPFPCPLPAAAVNIVVRLFSLIFLSFAHTTWTPAHRAEGEEGGWGGGVIEKSTYEQYIHPWHRTVTGSRDSAFDPRISWGCDVCCLATAANSHYPRRLLLLPPSRSISCRNNFLVSSALLLLLVML